MAPLDPNRTNPFDAGFEACATRDTRTYGSTLNSHFNGYSHRDNGIGANKDHPRAIHINQEVLEDEDELTIVSTQPHAPNPHASTRLPIGPANDLGLVGKLREHFQRLNPFSQDNDDCNTVYMHTTGIIEDQPVSISTVLRHDHTKENNRLNPSTDVERVETPYRSQISDSSTQLGDREACQHSDIFRLEARLVELSDRFAETQRNYQGRIADLESRKARETAEWAQKEAQCQNTISALINDKAKLTTEWRKRESQYQGMISNLEAQNSKHASKAAALQMQLNAACADFAKELAEAQAKNTFKQVNATDTEIQGSWKDLLFLVRQFVKEHCPASFSPSMLQERHVITRVPELSHFCLEPTLVLQHLLFAQSLLEMCIWGYLYRTIFDPLADYWAGRIGRHFMSACASLRDLISRNSNSRTSSSSLSAFHQWRSDSIHQLDKLGAIKSPSTEAMAAKMIDYLAPIMTLTYKGVPHPAAVADAVDIMYAAVKMDRIFRMSKAHYIVMISKGSPPFHPPFFGFHFDPACMEQKFEFAGFGDRNGSHPSDVDLVVSPAILKAGNNEGKNYQSKQFLVKLGVICNVQNFLAAAQNAQVKSDSSVRQGAPPPSTRTICTRSRARSLAGRERPSNKNDGSDIDMLDYPDNESKRADR